MHIVFGASALIMTIATLWMLAKDHNREWKDWQLADRKKDAWMIQAQRDQLADEFQTRMDQYETDLLVAAGQAIPAADITAFKQTVIAEQARLAGDDAASNGADEGQFADLDGAVAQLDQMNEAVAGVTAETQTPGDKKDSDGSASAALQNAREAAKDARDDVLAELQSFIRAAKLKESNLVGEKKAVNGERTAVVSELGLLNAHGGAPDAVEAKQVQINALDRRLDKLTEQIAAAKEYRLNIEAIVGRINSKTTELDKELGAMKTELARLDDLVYKNTTHALEWVTRWPVLNALYDGNIRIDQNWLPDLTINYNFTQAARFDRCTTCHRAISTTAPGTAADPAYPALAPSERDFTVKLATPEQQPSGDDDLRQIYGLVLSETGVVNDADVTVHYVLPESPAALAGLQSGDVLRAIGDAPVYDPESAATMLLSTHVTWGQPISVAVHRGLDHPFTTHPRLDLYLTDLSPHPQKDVGCTICHDGQGSGTDFKWTSHTPNNSKQQVDWSRDYSWFDNHHWIFPMKPSRFVESNCVKCHHQKGGLEPSEKFPEPPAAKLVEGWSTVEQYGCFGCHEVNGYAGPGQTIGPDVRLEPNYHEAAAALLRDEGLSDDERLLAMRLIEAPDDDEARHDLIAALDSDALLAARDETAGEARLASPSHKLADVLKDVEVPGAYRKTGPSLRHVEAKVDFDWLYSWIRRPADFRPSTKMPQFFGQHEHLEGEGLAVAQRFEPVEIRAITEYLLNNSADFQYLDAPENVTTEPSAERGAWLFESRGCLACHSHEQYPEIKADQGPDLSEIAAKFNTKRGEKWLYTWLKQPHRYHARTKMPNLYLDPIVEKDAQNQPTGEVTDPAADIAAYLMNVASEWTASDVPSRELSPPDKRALEDLALEWLTSDQIPAPRAKVFLDDGIPEKFASKVKEDERILVGMNAENREEKLLEYVGRRTISKYGCFGCHDIPGYETAKPIGAALAEWGRKDSSKLAFENIQAFLISHGIEPAGTADDAHDEHAEHDDHDAHAGHGHLDPGDFPADESYFIQALNSHSRDGFLWQKLRYPRSYDYKTTENKGYNERLRMPKFPFTDEQREAVMTFVLGLVNEPPAEKYLYEPDQRQQAIVDGRHVIDKFNCAGCHTMKMEQWEFAYSPDEFDSPSKITDFPFLGHDFDRLEIAESMIKDSSGLLHAQLHGLPVMDEETGQPQLVDEDGLAITREEVAEILAEDGELVPTYYQFTLWKDALLNGEAWMRGVQDVLIPAADEEAVGPARGVAHPAWGGDLARYLYPQVIAKAKEANPQVKGSEAWGWLPPPLMDEGEKVQPDWLHAFLMDPTALRPAAVMRMPNFKMSSDDAAKLVNYFAAASAAEFPYEYRPQQQSSYLARLEAQRDDPLGEAMNIVVDGNYCVKCHGVADYQAKGDLTTLGPNLADVSRRLRPTFIRDWIANPKRILPYTGMPVNIPYKPGEPHLGGVSQELYSGNSIEQVRGLVDLLMNFDAYARQRTSVSSLVKEAPDAAADDADKSASVR